MKKFFAGCCVAAMVAIWAGVGWALSNNASHDVTIDVQEKALIAVVDEGVDFTINGTPTPGDPPQVTPSVDSSLTGTDATTYLRYTSIVQQNQTRTITVHIDNAANIPPGTLLELQATGVIDPVPGTGATGTAASTKFDLYDHLTGTAAVLVTGIGSCYTGTTANSGLNLTYTLSISEENTLIENLFVNNYIIGVTYTLTAGIQ